VRSAQSVGLEIETIMVRPRDPLRAAFETMTAKAADAVIVQPSIMSAEAVELAMKHRLPSFAPNRLWPVTGG
jgi:hypothetical protein